MGQVGLVNSVYEKLVNAKSSPDLMGRLNTCNERVLLFLLISSSMPCTSEAYVNFSFLEVQNRATSAVGQVGLVSLRFYTSTWSPVLAGQIHELYFHGGVAEWGYQHHRVGGPHQVNLLMVIIHLYYGRLKVLSFQGVVN
jgi:hypothetical protein